jgi:hypothetical protein
MSTRKSNPKIAARYFRKQSRSSIDTARGERFTGKRGDVLADAFAAWTGLDGFRRKARRNKMYVFEDQWGDYVRSGCRRITERQSILDQGNTPLTNNRIRGIVRAVPGVYLSARTEPVCIARDRREQSAGEVMSAAVQYVCQLNKLHGLDGMNFQYFLVTGLAAFRSSFSWRNGKMDVWTDLVNYNRLFFDNHMDDPRHWDCHLIGEIHDVGLYDVMARFAEGSPGRAEEIRRLYAHCDRDRTLEWLESNLTEDAKKHLNFFIPQDGSRCRVIEVWKLESRERLLVHDRLTGDFYKRETGAEKELAAENDRRVREQAAAGVLPEDMRLIEYRWFIDNYWYYYFLTPQGDVLKEGETEFWHESHPYTFRIYPFFDGQVYPFVSDFIDQQRYINRLVMLQDFVTRSSAKGVLAIPEDSIPDGWSTERFAQEWARFNGVILYKSKPGVSPPHQIVSNSTQLGLTDMLSIQLRLLEDVSGVHGALQGKSPAAGTPAALYMQQTQNAATSLTELFEAYRELREERDTKIMKLIQQFYTEPRYVSITGRNAGAEKTVYDPNKVRNAEFDLSITESAYTPAYRLIMNDLLMQLFQAGQITLVEFLETGAFPFADKLLQSVKSREPNATEAQSAQGEGAPAIAAPGVRAQLLSATSPVIRQMTASPGS